MDICAYSLSCIIQRVYAHTHTHTHTCIIKLAPERSNQLLLLCGLQALHKSSLATQQRQRPSEFCRQALYVLLVDSQLSAPTGSSSFEATQDADIGAQRPRPTPILCARFESAIGGLLVCPGCRLSGENGAIGYSVRERVLRESIQQVVGIKLRSVVAHATQRRPTFNVLALWVEDGQMNDQHEAFVEQAA
eukprot:1158664-Pelagomonas_calceolata.AAC.7